MGLFDFIRNEFIEIIQWTDNSADTVIWKFMDVNADNNIKYGAKLVVRESQVAVFMNEGRIADVYGPGTHTLVTQNMPILTTLQGWKYGFESPFKVDVFFVSTRQFTNLKWGTMNPIIIRDPDFKQVRVRAFGVFSLRVADGGRFIKEYSGTNTIVKIGDVEDQLRTAIVSKFSDVVAKANVSVLDMARNYKELGNILLPDLKVDFAEYGLELVKFYIENTSLPPEVEQFLDKTTQMNMVGDMARFQQFQTGLSIEKVAENEGTAGSMMGIGVGSIMSNQMAASTGAASTGAASTGAASTGAANQAIPKEDKAQIMELLKDLAELKTAGILTEEEFAAKKAELLAKI